MKRWRVEGFEANFGFTITDLISIYMGRQFLEPLAGTPFYKLNLNGKLLRVVIPSKMPKGVEHTEYRLSLVSIGRDSFEDAEWR